MNNLQATGLKHLSHTPNLSHKRKDLANLIQFIRWFCINAIVSVFKLMLDSKRRVDSSGYQYNS